MSVKVRKQTDYFSEPTKPFKRQRYAYFSDPCEVNPLSCVDKREILLVEEQIRKLSLVPVPVPIPLPVKKERKEVKEVKTIRYTEEEVLKRIRKALQEQQQRLEEEMTAILTKTLKEQEESFEKYCADQLLMGLKKSVHDYFS